MEPWYTHTHKTWGDLLDEVAEKFPRREALVFGENRLTYAELLQKVNTFAKGLLRLGVRKGDHVALWMTNCPEWIFAQFAVYKTGAVLLPVYTRFKRDETEYALKQSDSSTLIFQDQFLDKIDALGMLREMCPELDHACPGELRSERLPRLRNAICLSERVHPNLYNYHGVMEKGEGKGLDEALRSVQQAVDPFDAMNIIYTSGTTGFPKGGLSMHCNNMASIHNTTERMGLDESHRCLLNLPLFSNFGCMFVAALSFLRGCCVVMHQVFDPRKAFETIDGEEITHLYGSPAYFISYLDDPHRRRFRLSSLRGGIVGGSPLPSQTMEEIIRDLGAEEILNVYGLSECGGIATTTLREDQLELKKTTVGVPLPNAGVKIVDPQTGKDLPPGTQGEVCLHDVYEGSCVGKGYYHMPEKTREAIDAAGWFHTGDLGVLEPNGYLRITGRVKDMFLVGGFNVYPVEIENVLHTYPKVKQAQVLGVPDHRLGEVGMAFIELREGVQCTEQEVIDFAAKRIANFKVPRYVKFVTDFPMTGSGKVRKFLLREQAITELGLSQEYAVSGAEHET